MMMKTNNNILAMFAGLMIIALSSSCSGSKEKKDISALPEDVRPVAESIIEDSPSKFASSVSYPVERPYPLHDVRDSAEMVKYYPTMVDEPLRNAVMEAPDSAWHHEGWRGWTLGDNGYFWIDSGKIYEIGYVSGRETHLLDSLRNIEIASLEPSMQAGWSPVLCVTDSISGVVFRIDSHDDANPPIYRLSGYARGMDLAHQPSLVLYGTLDIEGSMGNRIYQFADSTGNTAYYSPDMVSDEDEPAIEVDRRGDIRKYKAKPSYWLDLIHHSHSDSLQSK